MSGNISNSLAALKNPLLSETERAHAIQQIPDDIVLLEDPLYSSSLFSRFVQGVKKALSCLGSLVQWPFSSYCRRESAPAPTLKSRVAVESVKKGPLISADVRIEHLKQFSQKITGTKFEKLSSVQREILLDIKNAHSLWKWGVDIEDIKNYYQESINELKSGVS